MGKGLFNQKGFVAGYDRVLEPYQKASHRKKIAVLTGPGCVRGRETTATVAKLDLENTVRDPWRPRKIAEAASRPPPTAPADAAPPGQGRKAGG
jgi:hypothetical protein